ncbi:LegC family aminotransferase [Acinetobacter sp. 826659]|uniref:LegC family aminotransferase n=1 Tax=Acinetobacter sp. 826659 TaxID=1310764 RepID=UPI00044AA4B0|nr:LegC family aminotransferase [Acinetobacter sp. 826659]EXS32101.1 degT/DnrJ/EryC1/StrS aminotransferase family protein [Acinetobacter sp. 826659]
MDTSKFNQFVRDIYRTNNFIPLHEPRFLGNEKKYVLDTIDSTFVSSVGAYVNDFEAKVQQFTGCVKAIATVNGTAALHIALLLAGVKRDDIVITQALTFVATCNALSYIGAEPLFIDVSLKTLGLCPKALDAYLQENAFIDDQGVCKHKATNKRISAIVPMHTFGHPVEIDELQQVVTKWNIALVEDAAESLGSYYKGKHTGTFGLVSALSFNGNKVITTGGGGMVLCQDEELGIRAKHITTTAKIPHPYEFYHDENGFNYRLPNLNAALGCAQMEGLEGFLAKKRDLAQQYQDFFKDSDISFVVEPEDCRSNYWLNAIVCKDKAQRDLILDETNSNKVMTRPIWTLMTRLPMYQTALQGDLTNSLWFEERVVNIPSSVPLE